MNPAWISSLIARRMVFDPADGKRSPTHGEIRVFFRMQIHTAASLIII